MTTISEQKKGNKIWHFVCLHVSLLTGSNQKKSEALGAKTGSSGQSLSWFPQHEAAKSISTPPGRDASPSQVTPQQFVRFPQQFAGTNLYSWVEGGTVRVKVPCPRTQHNVPRPGLEPGPLDPGTSAVIKDHSY